MLSLRRWWVQNRLQFLFVGVLVAVAYGFRFTQGTILFEVYQKLAQPFTPSPTVAERVAQAEIDQLQVQVEELEAQNQKLSELLQYTKSKVGKGKVVPVIGRSADHWWQQITLGAGRNQGVEPGYVVTGPGGVMGRVTHVTSNTSRVLLISDHTSRVGVLVSRTRATGVIRGQSSNQVVMEFFSKDPQVQAGDVVTTSNFSQLFPAGLPVGKVVAIDLSKSPAPEATIELTAPLAFLETVVVSPYTPMSEDGGSSQH